MGQANCSSLVFLVQGKCIYNNDSFQCLIRPLLDLWKVTSCVDLWPAGQNPSVDHQTTSYQAGDLDLNAREQLAW